MQQAPRQEIPNLSQLVAVKIRTMLTQHKLTLSLTAFQISKASMAECGQFVI